MKTPPINPEEPDPLAAALRRDAARVREPEFDPALHQATLRRIRALEGSGQTRSVWWWKPAFASAAIFAVVALCLGLWLPRTAQPTRQHATAITQPDFAALLASTQAAVTSLSSDTVSPLPSWMSPTAPLLELDFPNLPPSNSKRPL